MNLFKTLFHATLDIFDYIFNLRIVDIPLTIAYIGVIALIGYIASMIIIGLPCSIIESTTKKKPFAFERENKIIRIVAIFIDVIILYAVFIKY